MFTFQETQEYLGIKARQSLYNYEKRGWLDGYIEKIEGVKYKYMKKIKGKTVVQHLRKNVFTIDLKDLMLINIKKVLNLPKSLYIYLDIV